MSAFTNLSWSLNVLNEYDEAIRWVDEAIRLDPNYAYAYYCKGNILEKQGLFKEAIDCYNRAIIIDPKYVNAFLSISSASIQI